MARDADATLAVEDPATGEVLTEIADATAEDALAALDAASAAQEEWAAWAPRERGEILRRAYEELMARQDELALLMTLEMGKPLAESRGEIAYAAEFFRWFAEEAVRIDGRFGIAPNGAGRLLTMKQPVGPCLLITPWNFPMAMGTRKIGPAVAAGCTMVVKPAQQTPLSMLALAEILERAGLPAGVLNIVTSSSASRVIGPLIADPRMRKLSFTGSTEVGQHARRAVAPTSCCACRWSWAATRRSSCSRTPTSTPPSTARCWPRCATAARPAPRRTASSCTRRSRRSSAAGWRRGWAR